MESPRGQTDKGLDSGSLSQSKLSSPIGRRVELKIPARKVLICQGSGAEETGIEKTASME